MIRIFYFFCILLTITSCKSGKTSNNMNGGTMETIKEPGFYKNDKAKHEYLNIYDSILQTWPVEYNTQNIEAKRGNTFVLNWGDKSKEPLILLHPNMCSSIDLKFLAETLSQKYNVYAIDIIGEPGKTDYNERPVYKEDYIDWLYQVISELNLNKVSIMGYSMGSAIAMYFTMEYSEIVNELLFLAPSLSIIPPPKQVTLKLTYNYFFKSLNDFADSTIEFQSSNFNELKVKDVEFYKRFKSSFFYFNGNVPKFKPLSVNELSSFNTPLSIIIGDSDEWIPYKKFFRKLDKAKVSYKKFILKGGNHLFSLDEKEKINEIIKNYF